MQAVTNSINATSLKKEIETWDKRKIVLNFGAL